MKRPRGQRNLRMGLALLGGLLAGLTPPVAAQSCWQVTGWIPPAGFPQQPILSPTACTTIPLTTGWTPVDLSYGAPPASPLWLRLPLSDSHVANWKFTPLLVFSHVSGGVPVISTDLIPCIGCPNYQWLVPFPPQQGVPAAGQKVRLRSQNTGHCLYAVGGNGGATNSFPCWNDPQMTFVLDAAGGGTFRLRHQASNQCLYAAGTSGAGLLHWGCWSDPNMRFMLEAAGGGYRLRHVNSSQCPFGNATPGGAIQTWGCWNDPAMVFKVDILP